MANKYSPNTFGMDDEEYQAFIERLTKDVQAANKLRFSNSASSRSMISNTNGYSTSGPYMGISPTDKDAREMYPYQEPEKDEQGTYYGYKVLRKHCSSPACDEFFSPRYHATWQNGHLRADSVPAVDHMHGLHFTKRSDHPELNNYYHDNSSWISYDLYVLVKCALYGTVVETEQGFRAEEATIIGVLDDGNWKTYQDYKERSRTYSGRNYEEITWEARFRYGRWQDPDTYFNPSADS